LRSLQPLSKGEELTISYGAEKPNSEVLRDYGFVLAGNSHDRIQWGSSSSRKVIETEVKAERDKFRGMYGLNEACLMEVGGYRSGSRGVLLQLRVQGTCTGSKEGYVFMSGVAHDVKCSSAPLSLYVSKCHLRWKLSQWFGLATNS
jgi:hypothetical protein